MLSAKIYKNEMKYMLCGPPLASLMTKGAIQYDLIYVRSISGTVLLRTSSSLCEGDNKHNDTK